MTPLRTLGTCGDDCWCKSPKYQLTTRDAVWSAFNSEDIAGTVRLLTESQALNAYDTLAALPWYTLTGEENLILEALRQRLFDSATGDLR